MFNVLTHLPYALPFASTSVVISGAVFLHVVRNKLCNIEAELLRYFISTSGNGGRLCFGEFSH